jgi:hypothetical protein
MVESKKAMDSLFRKTIAFIKYGYLRLHAVFVFVIEH